MNLNVQELGKIKECDFELNDLTILVGDNNSGKTYLTYSTYGVLKNWKDFVDFGNILEEYENQLKEKGQLTISKLALDEIARSSLKIESKKFQKRIKDLFNDKEKIFSNAKVSLDFDIPETYLNFEKKFKIGESLSFVASYTNSQLTFAFSNLEESDVKEFLIKSLLEETLCTLLFGQVFPNPIIITAERLGISLFYKELDEKRNSLVDGLQKLDESSHPLDIFLSMTAYYATPIKDHISFTRNLDNIKKNQSILDTSYSIEIIKELLGAEFKKDIKQDIRFLTKKKKNNKFDIPLYLASSSARCIVDIYFYLKHIAQQGDILIIDEPESHLTLKNQRLMAKLIVSLINTNIKVFITTHSDFLLKELNNLILLSNSFPEKEVWLKSNKNYYTNKDFLKPECVSVFNCVNGGLEKMKVSNKGMIIPFIDSQLESIYNVFSELDYLVEE
jgi:energy-coupling factor transporter ATP-binding protein EcfA2